MNYYVTLRVKIPAKNRGEALEMAADLTELVNNVD